MYISTFRIIIGFIYIHFAPFLLTLQNILRGERERERERESVFRLLVVVSGMELCSDQLIQAERPNLKKKRKLFFHCLPYEYDF